MLSDDAIKATPTFKKYAAQITVEGSSTDQFVKIIMQGDRTGKQVIIDPEAIKQVSQQDLQLAVKQATNAVMAEVDRVQDELLQQIRVLMGEETIATESNTAPQHQFK